MTNYQNPTHNLAQVIALVKQGRYRITTVALRGAAALGVDLDGVIAAVVDLPNTGKFHKTMESKQNPGHWMDVYRTRIPTGKKVYLKLMIQNGVLIVSFKEL